MMRPAIRALVASGALAVLAGCGGGGSGSPPPPPPPGPSLAVVPASLSFTATRAAHSLAPACQAVTGTVTGTVSGTLYVLITATGTAVQTVGPVTVGPGNSASAAVCVQDPILLGGGAYSSSIKVRACVNSSDCSSGELTGSPKTIAVNYTIGGDPLATTALPHALAANLPGRIELRGTGFTGATGASIGGTAASAITVNYDSSASVDYPAGLTPGLQPVTLTGSAAPFAANVAVVAPLAMQATTLQYPSQPARILGTLWDAERSTLYVGAAFAATNQNLIWRFTYAAGSWSSAQAIAVPELRDLALSNDGTRLVALTSTQVLEFDAANPTAATRTVTAPFTSAGAPGTPILLRFAFAGDGNAVLLTGIAGAASRSDAYLYMPVTGTFADMGAATQVDSDAAGITAVPIAYGNGTQLFVSHSGTGTGATNDLIYYVAQGDAFPVNFMRPELPDQPPATDNTGYSAFNDGINVDVTFLGGTNLTLIGFGPRYLVVLIDPQGSRIHALESDGKLHTYTLSHTGGPSGAEVGSGIPLAAPTVVSPTLRTAVTPDGAALFIAGDAGVAVVLAPG